MEFELIKNLIFFLFTSICLCTLEDHDSVLVQNTSATDIFSTHSNDLESNNKLEINKCDDAKFVFFDEPEYEEFQSLFENLMTDGISSTKTRSKIYSENESIDICKIDITRSQISHNSSNMKELDSDDALDQMIQPQSTSIKIQEIIDMLNSELQEIEKFIDDYRKTYSTFEKENEPIHEIISECTESSPIICKTESCEASDSPLWMQKLNTTTIHSNEEKGIGVSSFADIKSAISTKSTRSCTNPRFKLRIEPKSKTQKVSVLFYE